MNVFRKITTHTACCCPRRERVLAGLGLASFLIGVTALVFFSWAVRAELNAEKFFYSAGFISNVFAVLLFPFRWRPATAPEPPGSGCITSLRAVLSISCLLLAVWGYSELDGFLFAGEHKYWRAGEFLLVGSVFLQGAVFLFVRWWQGTTPS